MYTITFYVPESACEQVKNAMFSKGAGRYGNYECVSWQTLGIGQFRPLSGSNPTIGNINQITQLKEYRVEMICEKASLESVITVLLSAHPYEQVAYHVTKHEVNLISE